MTYDELLHEASQYQITVKEKSLKGNKGRIKGNRIAIRKDIPTLKEKACVLAEELGHYYTTVGNILSQTVVADRKQEYKARLWAYNKQVGLIGIIKAYESGYQSLFEIAEYLNVTEEFLAESLDCYRRKHGLYTTLDNYIIYFEPNLIVMKMI